MKFGSWASGCGLHADTCEAAGTVVEAGQSARVFQVNRGR
jgi:hypothetical protein